MISEVTAHDRVAKLGLADLAEVFLRHKKKAAAFALSVMALGALVILYAPRSYRSEARLFLQVGRESIRLDPTATTGDTIALQQSGRDTEVATTIEVLKSRAIVEKAVAQLTPEVVLGEAGAGKSEPSLVSKAVFGPLGRAVKAIKGIDPISKQEEAVIAVMENLEVFAEFDSTVVVLTYDAETPQLAQQVLATLVAEFSDEHVRLHQTSGSKLFFTAQRDELQKQLVAAQEGLREAKNRMGVASVETRRSSVESRLSSVELTRNATIQQLAAAEARIATLQSRIDDLPDRLHTSTRTMPNTAADSLRSQLYDLQVQLMNLEAKYSAEHPLVVSKRSQVAEAKKMAADEVSVREETVDSLNENQLSLELELAKVESEMAGLEAQREQLDAQQAAALAELKQLNDYELELEELHRNVQLANTNFFSYADALEQARMDEALDSERITNVNQAQAATLAEKPISPSKLIVGAMTLLLASTGTVALVLGAEKLDSRVHSEDQVEQALGLPVLATIPEGRWFGSIPARNV